MFLLRYLMVRALRDMKGDLFPHLATIGIIAVSMLIFSAFSLIAFNLGSLLQTWESKIEVIAYLDKRTPEAEIQILLRNALLLQGVEEARYISPSEAMAFMRAKIGSQKNLLDGIEPNVLPPSFEIKLKKEYRNSGKIKEVVSQLRQFPQIEEIQYGKEWVEAFSTTVHILRAAQWILGGLLLAAMTFIISNTLQLTIDSKRAEIEVMNLVGASPALIQIPFHIEGVIQGLLGTALALLGLFFLYRLFFANIPSSVREWLLGVPILFFGVRTLAWFLLGGMVLGFFGSFIASLRILRYSG